MADPKPRESRSIEWQRGYQAGAEATSRQAPHESKAARVQRAALKVVESWDEKWPLATQSRAFENSLLDLAAALGVEKQPRSGKRSAVVIADCAGAPLGQKQRDMEAD